MKTLGIYVHVPFCRSKCAYCDFYSFLPKDSDCPDRYTDAVIRDMERQAAVASDRSVDTVFFGGGTPTYLGCDRLLRIFEAIDKNFRLSSDCEFSAESNPKTVGYDDLVRMKSAGLNRLSIGLQSAFDRELKLLSRTHTYGDFLRAYGDARRAGLCNINVDLMYGIPGQTADSFAETLSEVTELSPEHISLYGLMLEEGTPFYRKRNSLPLPSEDEEADMYFHAAEFLRGKGYCHYEISNYAKNGRECRHNLRYWHCLEYLGFGPAAHSYFGGKRYSNISDAEAYIKAVADGGSPVDFREEIGESDRMAEYLMLGLRLSRGIDVSDFKEKFGIDFEEHYGKKLEKYIKLGKMEKINGRYALTDAGMYVSNTVMSDIIEF